MKLNEIYTSGMVFPRQKPIRICGSGKGTVRIEFAETVKVLESETEKWCMEFPPMESGGPYEMKVIFDNEVILLNDIWVGEVYLFAGQSNIEMLLKDTNTLLSEYKSNPKLRMFCVERLNKENYFSVNDGWVYCEKEQVGEWSALAYLAGQKLQNEKDVAVGVIVCCQGASVIESWLPKGKLSEIGIDIPVEEKYIDHVYPIFEEWNKDGVLYEKSLGKIIPYPVSAVVWYQGESDASAAEGEIYIEELKAFIETVRKDFGDEKLPFFIVQLADYSPRIDIGWKLVQKAQVDIQNATENTFTIVSADVCEKDDIHPPTKSILANRIADTILTKI